MRYLRLPEEQLPTVMQRLKRIAWENAKYLLRREKECGADRKRLKVMAAVLLEALIEAANVFDKAFVADKGNHDEEAFSLGQAPAGEDAA